MLWPLQQLCHSGLRRSATSLSVCRPSTEFGMEHPLTKSLRFRKKPIRGTIWGTYLGHKMARFSLFLLYLCSTCLKCFKFLLKSCKRPTEEYPVMLNYWDHVGAMFGPFWTMFGQAILPDQPELWNFQDWVNMVLGTFLWSVYFLGPYQGHIGTILVPCLV